MGNWLSKLGEAVQYAHDVNTLNMPSVKTYEGKANDKSIIQTPVLNYFRKSAYDNVIPSGYDNWFIALLNTALNEKKFDQKRGIIYNSEEAKKESNSNAQKLRDDIWATYLQIPENLRHKIPGKATIYPTRVVNGHVEYGIKPADKKLYDPTKTRDTWKGDTDYNLSGITEEDWETIIWETENPSMYSDADYNTSNLDRKYKELPPLKLGESKNSDALNRFLGAHAVGRAVDPKKGEYVSYGDLWDLAPFSKGFNGDETLGFGTPVHIYDRKYLDDYYGVTQEYRNPEKGTYYGGYLPEIWVFPSKKDGGKINYLNYFK